MNARLGIDVDTEKPQRRSRGQFSKGRTRGQLPEGLLELATQLLTRQAKPFRPEQYKDSYAVELRQLVAKKAKGQKIEIPPEVEAGPAKVVSIMDALKRSLKEAPPAPAKKRAARGA